MATTFDEKRIRQILFDFYNITGITITLFDSDFNSVADEGEWQPYCLEIRNHVIERCHECDRMHSHDAVNQHGTLTYTCHAGIAEAVAPIFFEDELIAYLMIGKFRDADGEYSSDAMVRKAAQKYGLDEETMLEHYRKLPVLTKSRIKSAISLLEICLYYIINEEYILAQRNSFATQIKKYIETHISEKISIEDLCKEFGYSTKTLYANFEREFNDTPQNYIIEKRLQKAKELLETTDLPICNIATTAGFESSIYFSRIFRTRVGIPPTKYRKSKKGN